MSEEVKKSEDVKKTTAVKTTEAANKAYSILKTFYKRAAEATANKEPVAWCMTNVLCEEILEAMGVQQIYTENFAGVCAAKKAAGYFIEIAEADGYSQDICSYVRTGVGYAIKRKELGVIPPEAPNGGMADPTLIVGSTTQCEPRYKWYQSLGRYMNVPYFCFENASLKVPCGVDADDIGEMVVKNVVKELKQFQKDLEKMLGHKMDEARLREIVENSEATKNTYWKCLEMSRNIPCPMPAEDMFTIMPLGMFYMHKKESLEFFRALYAELEGRVKNKQGVIPDEKYRLLWGWGIPSWHSMSSFNYFEQRNAVCVMESCYSGCAGGVFEEGDKYSDPIERVVRGYFFRMNVANKRANINKVTPNVQTVLNLVHDFSCDGVVLNTQASCRPQSVGQKMAVEMLHKYIHVPVLILESDMADERNYSAADTNAHIDAFIETVGANKNVS
jgi:benzoyl-CoA reductase/2-hydroxyglutaryl-CoA dehydratase subunit BcrC/BadD/HgdB